MSLSEPEAKALLAELGVDVPRGIVASNAREAAAAAGGLRLPVVVKVVSPDIVHKSDVGGVQTGLGSPAAVAAASEAIMRAVQQRCPGARIDGLLVEEQLTGGVECVAGLVRRTVLGPAVMFGLGGLFIELFDDVAFRVAPLSEADALEMVAAVRASRMLDGYRGTAPVDRAALAAVLLRLSDLACTGDIAELDINPLLALPDRAVALDATITLTAPAAASRHMGEAT